MYGGREGERGGWSDFWKEGKDVGLNVNPPFPLRSGKADLLALRLMNGVLIHNDELLFFKFLCL